MHFCVSDHVSEWLSQIVLDKVHLRQEIKASRPPGGDPLQRSAAVIGMVPGQDATILAKLDTGMA